MNRKDRNQTSIVRFFREILAAEDATKLSGEQRRFLANIKLNDLYKTEPLERVSRLLDKVWGNEQAIHEFDGIVGHDAEPIVLSFDNVCAAIKDEAHQKLQEDLATAHGTVDVYMLKPTEYDLQEHSNAHSWEASHRVIFDGSKAWRPDFFEQYEKVITLPALDPDPLGDEGASLFYDHLQNHPYGFRDMATGDILHDPKTGAFVMKERSGAGFSVVSATNKAWVIHSNDALTAEQGKERFTTPQTWQPEAFKQYTPKFVVTHKQAPIIESITPLLAQQKGASAITQHRSIVVENLSTGQFFLRHKGGFAPVAVVKPAANLSAAVTQHPAVEADRTQVWRIYTDKYILPNVVRSAKPKTWKPSDFSSYVERKTIPQRNAPIIEAVSPYLKTHDQDKTFPSGLPNGAIVENAVTGQFYLKHRQGIMPIEVTLSANMDRDPQSAQQEPQAAPERPAVVQILRPA